MRKSNAPASREVSLWSLRKERSISLDARMDVAKRLLTTIARMHERRLVHGRLEPSTIQLRGVRSFRVTVSVDEAPSSGVRDLRYSPPERDASMLGDVFALGVILGELLDDAPEGVRAVLAVMTDPNPAARYASAQVAMNAFARVAPSTR